MVKKNKRPWLNWVMFCLAGLFFAALLSYVYIAWLLPIPDSLDLRPRHVSTKILDRNGQLLYEVLSRGEGRKSYLKLDQMPVLFQKAVIASEDSDYYAHAGVDLGAVARALFYNYLEQKVTSGASTITQQLVRNLLGTNRERNFQEKIVETIYAIRISNAYSKEKILEEYLNTVYFGNLSYGVAEAARNYFGKNLEDLDLAEFSLLAGLPKAPSTYNPLVSFEKAKKRQKYVLGRLVEQADITAEQADEAFARELHFASGKTSIEAPHFVHHVLAEMEEKYGEDQVYAGLTIHTTLDLNLQKEAEQIVNRQLDKLQQKNVGNAALLAATVPEGQILVWLGSRDYFNDQIDGQVDVIGAARQPGSALKPFLYLLALEAGDTLATLIPDLPMKIKTPGGVYSPLNYDLDFHGPVRLREALANSFNIPAVKTQEKIGTTQFLTFLRQLGLDTLDQDAEYYGLSLTLGGGEIRLKDLANAYLTLANSGKKKDFSDILEIVDATGTTIYRWTPLSTTRVLGPHGEQNAWLITNALSDPNARLKSFGEGSVLELDVPAAAKTGTTRNFRDNWTFGYTSNLLTAVWVGNSDATPMENISGIDGAGPIWHDFMTTAGTSTIRLPSSYKALPLASQSGSIDFPPPSDPTFSIVKPTESKENKESKESKESKENFNYYDLESRPFPLPTGIIEQPVCAVSGLAPTENCQEVLNEWFVQGTQPRQNDYFWQKYTCSTDNGGSNSAANTPTSTPAPAPTPAHAPTKSTDEALTPAPALAPASAPHYYITYPFLYQNWAAERGFLPPSNCQISIFENAPQDAIKLPPLQITSPLSGDSFQINKNLPLTSQRIPIKVSVYPAQFSNPAKSPSQINLYLDDQIVKTQEISDLGTPVEIKEFWLPEIGSHTLKVELMAKNKGKLVTETSTFKVE